VHPAEFSVKLKNQIRGRDGYMCQECGMPEKTRKHPVHHIDFDKENNNEGNLITLCSHCHGKTTRPSPDELKYWVARYQTKMANTA